MPRLHIARIRGDLSSDAFYFPLHVNRLFPAEEEENELDHSRRRD
ncbi:hypothetical protein NZD89_08695 [Alicyclobacillus fastidiosus]|uniref:Uncharacterized protein n=1 Tax=Alicyclobacillus fastidiosus TaxID=392011 RepID=A0ABY6ZKI7_9BACL|nr:hypothetical protein [Alicyclobacillus fastidiosus]WAH43444.1 hypothetical protein NZD89_08695 [Alicyclobacillus fastidiosus]